MYIDPYTQEGSLAENQNQLYIQSQDPWDNQGTYIKQFDGILDHLSILKLKKVHLVDIGCGGGNVLEGLIYHINKLTEEISITGVDISKVAIDYLRKDPRFSKYNPSFIVDDFRSIRKLPYLEGFLNLYSMVDVFCSAGPDYKEVAVHIWDLIPPESLVLVADCDVKENRKFKKLYNSYSDAEILINYTTPNKVVTPKSKEWSSKFNWSIYRKRSE